MATKPEDRHPSSLTKIMTLYLLFEHLEGGKRRLDTQLSFRRRSRRRRPSSACPRARPSRSNTLSRDRYLLRQRRRGSVAEVIGGDVEISGS